MMPVLVKLNKGKNEVKYAIRYWGNTVPGLKLWLVVDEKVKDTCPFYVVKSGEVVPESFGAVVGFSDDCAIFSPCAPIK